MCTHTFTQVRTLLQPSVDFDTPGCWCCCLPLLLTACHYIWLLAIIPGCLPLFLAAGAAACHALNAGSGNVCLLCNDMHHFVFATTCTSTTCIPFLLRATYLCTLIFPLSTPLPTACPPKLPPPFLYSAPRLCGLSYTLCHPSALPSPPYP
jgi:hypothetical protein